MLELSLHPPIQVESPLATLSLPIAAPVAAKNKTINLPLGYLRAFVILCVVLHHAVMPYFPNAPLPPHSLLAAPRGWLAFAIVDPAKWSGFTPFILFNDAYTMALLFLVSGLFTWRSLHRKKPLAYLLDRMKRLGGTLLFMLLLVPAAYYPSYLQSQVHDGFWHEWVGLHQWPLGPAWFLLALLVFDLLAIAIYCIAPRALEAAGRGLLRVQSPVGMVLIVAAVSGLVFVPLVAQFGMFGTWVFFFPVARILHDASYFLIGLALGSADLKRGTGTVWITARGRLASHWLPLLIAAPAAFAGWQGSVFLSHRIYNPGLWTIVTGLAFALSCAVSVLAALAVFLHFVRGTIPFWDSLLACSLGIYAIHFVPMSWVQLCLLPLPAPGWLKGAIAFLIVFPLSWSMTLMARRSPRIARFL